MSPSTIIGVRGAGNTAPPNRCARKGDAMAAEYSTFVPQKPSSFIDRSGVRYGRLVAFRPLRKTSSPREAFWECVCDCGKTAIVRTGHLAIGQTRSCGCLQREAPQNVRHGLHHTRAYRAWCSMKKRCNSPSDENYARYGGRGISYDPRWESVENFVVDMGECPPELTLERNDNNANYSKDNCRWATRRENINNRNNTLFVEYRGRRVPAADLARECGLTPSQLRRRLMHGWSIERAVTAPLRQAGVGNGHRTR